MSRIDRTRFHGLEHEETLREVRDELPDTSPLTSRAITPGPNTRTGVVPGASHAGTSGTSNIVSVRSGPAPLPNGFAWYGDEVHPIAPRFVADEPETLGEIFFDFSKDASTEGKWGSGTHLGDGFVLTAFHVARYILRHGEPSEDFFYGDGADTWDHSWRIKALPPRGSYEMDGQYIAPSSDESFNDFAIVLAESHAGKRAIRGLRATADLAPDEPIFVVGDRTGGHTRIEQSALAADQTNALNGTATLSACDLEAGFSGSPVVDRNGLLVGVIFGTNDVTSSMVRSETILPLIRGAQEHLGLPALGTVGFPA